MTNASESEGPLSSSTRRGFLGAAAALTGVAAITSCKTTRVHSLGPIPRGRPRVPLAADEPIRMGIIGPGGMGTGHLEGIVAADKSQRERVKVVAVAEVCKPRLDRATKRLTLAQGFEVDGYRDYRELLARNDLHCVLIATPEHWHVPMAIDAIAAGKDVYVEKPLCMHVEDALHLKRVVEANDSILQVGTQYMTFQRYREARKLIADGVIGHPTLSQTSYCRNSTDGEWLYEIEKGVEPGPMLDWKAWCGPEGEQPWDTNVYHRWRRFRKWSTGIVGDLLPHWMTPMIWAVDAGWPVRVTGTGGHYVFKDMENHDQVFLTAQFEKEHTLVVAGSVCNDTGLEVLIRGHKANLLLGGNNCVVQPQQEFVNDVDAREVQCLEGGDSQDNLRLDFFRSVRTRQPNASPIEWACKAMVVIDLATRSLWDGAAWEFDPKTGTAHKA
ncbi:MAG: Gfo/Idh/MocA family oxidoreductase [Planctomycetes bacterium]|nr:Gfo/Idh/MocA family oxidoreductase [Planctomycetota bacterium]